MFFWTRTMTYTNNYLERIESLRRLLDEADAIIVGAGAGLSSAAGIQYSGPEFERTFRPWIERYGITDLYTSSFYPFETQEELWAYWAMHVWFARYRPDAMPLYRQLYDLLKDRNCFVITTNVDGQFEKAGFDPDRIFATQGDYGLFQPKTGRPGITWSNREWVDQVLPMIKDCRIPSDMVPHVPGTNGEVAMNLRCDNTFVEDERWHVQDGRYYDFVEENKYGRLLLLEFGVGFNTPVIIRFPFERMAAQWKHTTLVRFNSEEQQSYTPDLTRMIGFREDIGQVLSDTLTNQKDR